jgi:hypothetical protein
MGAAFEADAGEMLLGKHIRPQVVILPPRMHKQAHGAVCLATDAKVFERRSGSW